MWGDFSTSGPWMVFGMMHMLLWWVLIVVGIVVLVKWIGGHTRASADRALEILDERYARGEIDKDEFEDKRATLTGRRAQRAPTAARG